VESRDKWGRGKENPVLKEKGGVIKNKSGEIPLG